MTVFLASPASQLQADKVTDMPVLISFAVYSKWLDKYQQCFGDVLIDSGAYSEINSGKTVELSAYADFAARWRGRAVAVAALDDISGDWRRSLKNLENGPGFPTMHSSDPPELLDELIPAARERGGWLGIGITPPRLESYTPWLQRTLERIPSDIHVHGWALRRWWCREARINSVDSTNWWRDAMALRARAGLGHLSYAECLEIVVKRYKRERRTIAEDSEPTQRDLFKGG